MEFRRLFHAAVLMVFDYLAFFLSFKVGTWLFTRWVTVPPIDHREYVIFPLIIFLFFLFNGLYTRKLGLWEEMRRLYRGLIAAHVIIFLFFMFTGFPIGLSFMLAGVCLAATLIVFPVERDLVQRLLYFTGICRERVIIVGEKKDVLEVYRTLKGEPHLCFDIVGFVMIGDNPSRVLEGVPVIGHLDQLERAVQEKGVNTVIIATPPYSRERISALYAEVSKLVRNILVVPPLRGFAILNAQLYPLFFRNFLLVHHQNRLKDPLSVFLKELGDRIFALLLLPILLPIMAIIYVLIKLDSRGPAIYTHERVGKHGKIFKVYKFRTMYPNADQLLQEILARDPKAREEWNRHYKLKNDPRVTRIGRFLRKTSLDELPQIFNILKGEMSFVGPRPVLVQELEEYYRENTKFYIQVKPGITGLWQVSGRNKTDYPTRVFLDSWYVLNWSLWLDFMIILKTFKVILLMEGAY